MNNPSTRFESSPDGWFHIVPQGTFPHPSGAQQVIDAESCDAMQRAFREESAQPNFPGLLVDFDHFSHDPAQPTAAAGWITALEHRPDGLHAQVRWSDLGQKALDGGRYRLASPVWSRADCDHWTAPIGDDPKPVPHVRPRRLDRVALTNDPNLPGLAPLTNRRGETPAASVPAPTLRNELRRHFALPATADDAAILAAFARQYDELAALRNRAAHEIEVQADADLERFADVITNRDVVRAQLLSNRDSTLALLEALRRPVPFTPLHQPRLHRPNLHLLGNTPAEGDSASARRIANRARQLQGQLKIGHHAAFRLAEGEDAAA